MPSRISRRKPIEIENLEGEGRTGGDQTRAQSLATMLREDIPARRCRTTDIIDAEELENAEVANALDSGNKDEVCRGVDVRRKPLEPSLLVGHIRDRGAMGVGPGFLLECKQRFKVGFRELAQVDATMLEHGYHPSLMTSTIWSRSSAETHQPQGMQIMVEHA